MQTEGKSKGTRMDAQTYAKKAPVRTKLGPGWGPCRHSERMQKNKRTPKKPKESSTKRKMIHRRHHKKKEQPIRLRRKEQASREAGS